ncbi:unnamed protein product [Urochloa decumbens]|uniref:Disease resistance N-terminal domain-containing protein n=1 Tax=Urochloa decumbens TaxID=240449 RepID=A0ABC9GS32_9POAL
MSDLLSRALSMVIQRYKRSREEEAEHKLQQLQRVLLRVDAMVEEAEGRHITNQAMLRQLEMLRQGMYGGHYMLDTIKYRGDDEVSCDGDLPVALPRFSSAKRLPSFPVSSSNANRQNTETLKKLEMMLDGLETLMGDMLEFAVFLQGYPRICRQPYSTYLILGNVMFGRQMEMETVINFLLRPETPASKSPGVLPIIGLARIELFRSPPHHHHQHTGGSMAAEEMTNEEFYALFLAKLEELGKKMDERIRKLEGHSGSRTVIFIPELRQAHGVLINGVHLSLDIPFATGRRPGGPHRGHGASSSSAHKVFDNGSQPGRSRSGACGHVVGITNGFPDLFSTTACLCCFCHRGHGASTSDAHEVFDVGCQPSRTPSGGCGDTLGSAHVYIDLGSTPGQHPRRPYRHHQAHRADILDTAHAFISLCGCSGAYKQAQRPPMARHRACNSKKLANDKPKDIKHIYLFGMVRSFCTIVDISTTSCEQGNKAPKPPWLICAEVSNSWSGKMLLINGFLLEGSPWWREYLEFVQLKIAWPPPMPLKVASKGANLRPSPWPFLCYSKAESKLSNLLVLQKSSICNCSGAAIRAMRRFIQNFVHISHLLKKLTGDDPNLVALISDDTYLLPTYNLLEYMPDYSSYVLWQLLEKGITRKPWPPPSRVYVLCYGAQLRSLPWSSFSVYCIKSHMGKIWSGSVLGISVHKLMGAEFRTWMVWGCHYEQISVVCLLSNFDIQLVGCLLELLDNADGFSGVQVDACSRRYVELFQPRLHQRWLFTEILIVGFQTAEEEMQSIETTCMTHLDRDRKYVANLKDSVKPMQLLGDDFGNWGQFQMWPSIQCKNAKQLKHVMSACLSSEAPLCKVGQLQLKADKLLAISNQAILSDMMDNTVAFQAAIIERVFQSMTNQVFLSDVMNNTIALQAKAGEQRYIWVRDNITAAPHGNGRSLAVIELAGDMDEEAWSRLYCSAASSMGQGSKIVITSRSEKIASLGTTKALRLKALPQEAYWYFFKALAFGSANPSDQPKLASLAMEIAALLNGTFLGANVVGSLMRANQNTEFWFRLLQCFRDYTRKHLLMFGEHPIKLTEQGRPVHTWSMARSHDVPTIIGIRYQKPSPQDDVPEVTVQDIISGRSTRQGNFSAVAWRSTVPPYYTYLVSYASQRAGCSTAKKRPRHARV